MKIKLTKPLTAKEIEAPTGALRATDISQDERIDAIATHSDEVEKNTLFLAFCGEKTHGDRFHGEVTKRGGCIMSEKSLSRGFKVTSVSDALFSLAKDHLASLKRLKSTVCITGSVGKTTTKEILSRILSPHAALHATEGNQNSEIGLPLTVLAAAEDTEILLLEAGMNHRGELARLSYLARPDLAIITNIGYAHVGNLGSREAIAEAKKEILLGMKEGGTALIPDSEALLSGIERAKKISLHSEDADYALFRESESILFKDRAGARILFPTDMKDPAMLSACAFAAAAALHLGIAPSLIENAISKLSNNIFRQKVYKKNKTEIIFDAYNASPESVLNAIRTLCEKKDGRACALVLGDMRELGAYTESQNERIAAAIAEPRNAPALLFLFGENASSVARYAIKAGYPRDRIFENPNAERPEDTAKEILNNAKDGMRIVIKGAHGMRMERILHLLTKGRDGDKNA